MGLIAPEHKQLLWLLLQVSYSWHVRQLLGKLYIHTFTSLYSLVETWSDAWFGRAVLQVLIRFSLSGFCLRATRSKLHNIDKPSKEESFLSLQWSSLKRVVYVFHDPSSFPAIMETYNTWTLYWWRNWASIGLALSFMLSGSVRACRVQMWLNGCCWPNNSNLVHVVHQKWNT